MGPIERPQISPQGDQHPSLEHTKGCIPMMPLSVIQRTSHKALHLQESTPEEGVQTSFSACQPGRGQGAGSTEHGCSVSSKRKGHVSREGSQWACWPPSTLGERWKLKAGSAPASEEDASAAKGQASTGGGGHDLLTPCLSALAWGDRSKKLRPHGNTELFRSHS